MYWVSKLDKLPPNVCRLLARVPHKAKQALTTDDIARRSGFSKQKVRAMSRLRSWKDVTVGDMEIFKSACGIAVGKGEALQLAYLRRSFDKTRTQTPLYHLRRLMKDRKDKRLVAYFSELMKVDQES